MYNLFPQFVIVGSHTQGKLIQPNIALVLFYIVAFHAIRLKKRMSGRGVRHGLFVVRIGCGNTEAGAEDQEAGVLPGDADAFIAQCRDEFHLPVTGLMCIPPVDEEPSLHFALLAEIARRNGLAGLSMGMSGDYETAVRFGATHVRVGSAIFGARTAHATA